MSARSRRWLAAATLALAVPASAVEVLGTSADLPPPPAPACTTPDCATVESITDLGRGYEPVSGVDGPGVYMAQDTGGYETPLNRLARSGLMPDSPYFSAQDEALAPLEGESGMVKRTNLWRVVVRFDDGSQRAIQQDYPPPFQPGDRVRVDGDRLQFAR
jgi:hypothetical protein